LAAALGWRGQNRRGFLRVMIGEESSAWRRIAVVTHPATG
jgi:hypothetical protein